GGQRRARGEGLALTSPPPASPRTTEEAAHPTARFARPALFAASCALNGALLWFFHRRFWYAPDEGNYAHVAQRLLAGEVLHRDVQDVHPGYINLLNGAAFRLFG